MNARSCLLGKIRKKIIEFSRLQLMIFFLILPSRLQIGGWSDGGKVSCIFCRWGVQLIIGLQLGNACYPCSR